jgi:integrase/recombinase XerD
MTTPSPETHLSLAPVTPVSSARHTAITSVEAVSQDYAPLVANVTGQLSAGSQRVYQSDVRAFVAWLQEHNYPELSREALIAYHAHLRSLKPNTAARKWSVVRRLAEEYAIRREWPSDKLTRNIRGYQKRESFKHIALTEDEARQLLGTVDRATKKGQRDYALLRLMIRLALRRSEAAKLELGDMGMRQGHHTLLIRQSKEEKDRLLKLPVDLWRMVLDYLEAISVVTIPLDAQSQRHYEAAYFEVGPDFPLFVGFDKGDHPTTTALHDDTIYRLVRDYGRRAGIRKLTSHSLRASGITLMLEREAPLWKVQDLAGHADPRTTRMYQKRKEDLDENAADVLNL